MPRGMSRCGFLVSSAAVATMSKPMKAKKTSEARGEDAHDAERGGGEAEQQLDQRRVQAARRLCGSPGAGMNGE